MAANKEAIRQKVMERKVAAQAAAMAQEKLRQAHQAAAAKNAEMMKTPIQRHQDKSKKLTPTQQSMKNHMDKMKARNILKGK